VDRRNFLKSVLATGALYSTGGLPIFSTMASAATFPAPASRILVNVMLSGGPDMRHLFPPPFDLNPASYGYQSWRVKARAHAIADSSSAWQSRWENDYFHVTHGTTTFGILKSCAWLKTMWDAGKVAIICNAVGATSRDHAHCQLVMDQGNLTSGPNDFNRPGWGGRLAAATQGNVVSLTRAPRRFCYGPHPSDPENHDNRNLVAARNTRQMALYQPPASERPTTTARATITRSVESYYAAKSQEISPNSVYHRFVALERSAREFGDVISARLAQVPEPLQLSALYKGALTTPYFGEQLRNLYDSLMCSDILQLRVASLEFPNYWDTHKDQRTMIEPKLTDMFGSGKGFDALFQQLTPSVLDNMVLVISGEFGRQLKANGGNGTDHGRGNAMIVIGNRVRGGIYGEMFPEEELSRIEIASADITGRTAFDHVFGRVCDWVSPGSGDVVFPNRGFADLEPGVSFSNLLV
jgi:uncharacterized protein (DUF1501 family)